MDGFVCFLHSCVIGSKKAQVSSTGIASDTAGVISISDGVIF